MSTNAIDTNRARVGRRALGVCLALTISSALLWAPASGAATRGAASAPSSPGGPLTRANTTPFPSSGVIASAQWASGRYDPPSNQTGDILSTVWGDDGSSYVMIDDGGVDAPVSGGLWRQSLARIAGSPPKLAFEHVGNPLAPPPHTWAQIGGDMDIDDGPLGPYYSIGFTEVGGVFYATQERDWSWIVNSDFTGLVGVAYSTSHGRTWSFANKPFAAPLGNLTFVVTGKQGGGPAPDGYVYAIGTEREFNASTLLLGRARPGIANITDPARWQWLAGYTRRGPSIEPVWSGSLRSAVAVMSWSQHITYPQMTYDAPLHRYLLTFTYSYSSALPAVWQGGAQLVILDASTPWGPFSFVAGSHGFGPSNGYGAGFPAQWISGNGTTLWLKWAANFDGCAKGLDCAGKYGFNVAKVQLTLAADKRPKAPPAPTAKPRTRHRRILLLAAGSLPFLLLARSARAVRRARADRLRGWSERRA